MSNTHVPAMPNVLAFRLGERCYGIGFRSIRAVRNFSDTVPVCSIPGRHLAHLKARLHFRGVDVPVIDMRTRFGVAARNKDADSVVMFVADTFTPAAEVAGLMVDDIELVAVSERTLAAASDDPLFEEECIVGVSTCGGTSIALLDVKQVMKQIGFNEM